MWFACFDGEEKEYKKCLSNRSITFKTGFKDSKTWSKLVKESINGVMNSVSKEIDTVAKVTLDLSEIYNDLLKSDQNGSSPMLNIPHWFVKIHPHLKILVVALLKVVENLMFALTIMIRKFYAFLKTFSVRETLLRVNLKWVFHLYRRNNIGCLVVLCQMRCLT